MTKKGDKNYMLAEFEQSFEKLSKVSFTRHEMFLTFS